MFEMRPFCLVVVVCCWVMLNVYGTIQGNMTDTRSIIDYGSHLISVISLHAIYPPYLTNSQGISKSITVVLEIS